MKYLEESWFLMKCVSETIENEAKEQTGGFFCMILVALAASLLGSMLAGKEVVWAGEGKIRAGDGFS